MRAFARQGCVIACSWRQTDTGGVSSSFCCPRSIFSARGSRDPSVSPWPDGLVPGPRERPFRDAAGDPATMQDAAPCRPRMGGVWFGFALVYSFQETALVPVSGLEDGMEPRPVGWLVQCVANFHDCSREPSCVACWRLRLQAHHRLSNHLVRLCIPHIYASLHLTDAVCTPILLDETLDIIAVMECTIVVIL